jgi:hypothetical protein
MRFPGYQARVYAPGSPELVRYSFAFMGSIGVETTTFMIEKRNRAMHWMISQMNGLVIREFEASAGK